MIKKALINLIYETASIQRWNDHIRPYTGFTELDKQAHKMFYAYVLAKCEGTDHVDMQKLIEGGICEFFHRSILTDIKPPIYHKLMAEKGEQIDKWVIDQLEPDMKGIGGGFFDRLKQYLLDPEYAALEKKILKAAHYYASNWEFKIIYPMNKGTYDIEQVKGVKNVLFGGQGLFFTTLTGPGKVWLQTLTASDMASKLSPHLPSGSSTSSSSSSSSSN